MQTHTSGGASKLSLVEPHQVHGSIDAAAPETLGARVLELSSILQTTLDIEHQLELFSTALLSHLEIGGLRYVHPDGQTVSEFGAMVSPRATYDLKLEQTSLGSLQFFREVPLTNRDLKLLENLLCGLVYPLRNALSYQAALKLASHDPLTGAQNRMGFDMALQREVDLAHRQSAPLSMLVVDADHFKRFNDEFGHSFGDDVLRALGNAASTTMRRCDLLFRYGGEEFVILASHTGEDGAMLLAERIRQSIKSIRVISGREIELSVSIGVTQLLKDDTPESFFARCDEAMYEAKRSGRNRAVRG